MPTKKQLKRNANKKYKKTRTMRTRQNSPRKSAKGFKGGAPTKSRALKADPYKKPPILRTQSLQDVRNPHNPGVQTTNSQLRRELTSMNPQLRRQLTSMKRSYTRAMCKYNDGVAENDTINRILNNFMDDIEYVKYVITVDPNNKFYFIITLPYIRQLIKDNVNITEIPRSDSSPESKNFFIEDERENGWYYVKIEGVESTHAICIEINGNEVIVYDSSDYISKPDDLLYDLGVIRDVLQAQGMSVSYAYRENTPLYELPPQEENICTLFAWYTWLTGKKVIDRFNINNYDTFKDWLTRYGLPTDEITPFMMEKNNVGGCAYLLHYLDELIKQLTALSNNQCNIVNNQELKTLFTNIIHLLLGIKKTATDKINNYKADCKVNNIPNPNRKTGDSLRKEIIEGFMENNTFQKNTTKDIRFHKITKKELLSAMKYYHSFRRLKKNVFFNIKYMEEYEKYKTFPKLFD